MKCPKCENMISKWNWFKALNPFNMKCDHCKTKLKLKGKHLKLLILIMVFITCVVGLLLGGSSLPMTHAFGILILYAIFVEIIFFYLARTLGWNFEIKK